MKLIWEQCQFSQNPSRNLLVALNPVLSVLQKSGYDWVINKRSFPVARTTMFKTAMIAGAK